MSEPQVIVIGSGPGGSAIAWSLASAGVKVRILEAGPRYNPAVDYNLSLPSWERSQFPGKILTWGRQTHAPMQVVESNWDTLRSWNHLNGKTLNSDKRLLLLTIM